MFVNDPKRTCALAAQISAFISHQQPLQSDDGVGGASAGGGVSPLEGLVLGPVPVGAGPAVGSHGFPVLLFGAFPLGGGLRFDSVSFWLTEFCWVRLGRVGCDV